MIQLYMYIFFLIFLSVMVCHRLLNTVPYAIQLDFAVYPLHTKQFVAVESLSPVWLCSLASVARHAPLSMGFPRPGKNTEVGCHFLLQGIFLNQGSNPCLLHQQVDSLPLSHRGSRDNNLYLLLPDTQSIPSSPSTNPPWLPQVCSHHRSFLIK